MSTHLHGCQLNIWMSHWKSWIFACHIDSPGITNNLEVWSWGPAEFRLQLKYCAYGSDYPLRIGGTKTEEEHGAIHTWRCRQEQQCSALQCFTLQSTLTLYNYSNTNVSGCGIIMQFTFIIRKSDNAIIKTKLKVCLQSCTIQVECSSIVDCQCHNNQDSP